MGGLLFGTTRRGLGGQTSYHSMCHYNCLWSLKVKHYCNRQSNQCAPTTRHITQHSTQCQLSMSWRHVRKHHLMQTSYDRTYCHLSSALFAVHRPAVLSRLYTYSSYSPRILSQHIQFWTDRQCYLESINADSQTDRQSSDYKDSSKWRATSTTELYRDTYGAHVAAWLRSSTVALRRKTEHFVTDWFVTIVTNSTRPSVRSPGICYKTCDHEFTIFFKKNESILTHARWYKWSTA